MELSGAGEILDLTLSGLAFQLDRDFPHPNGATYLFTLVCPEIPVLPSEARLRWFRRPARARRGDPIPPYQCGAIFQPIADPAKTEAWLAWITDALASSDDAHRRTA